MDKIFFRIFKDSLFSMLIIIIYIVNNFFVINIFVCVWKIVEVIFIFKCGNLDVFNNYCFILLLLIVLKVIERLVYG